MNKVTVTLELTPEELMKLSDYLTNPQKEPAAAEPPAAEEIIPQAEAFIDKSALRAIGTELAKAGKSGDLKAVFEKYGAAKLGEVKPEDYEACYKDLEALRDA